jgi:SM-20-related protein
MDLFDWETFRATPLSRDPYEHVIVSGFVKPEALGKINADYPAIEDTGSFPIEGLQFGPGFRLMVDALESEQFRKAFEEKFQVDLSGRPTTITVRGRCAGGDGQIHTDSVGKIITILIYLNPLWDDSGGRLRLLRAKNIEDVAAEVVPSGGNIVAFLRSDHSWHGHLPFSGERRVVQFNWVANKRNQTIVFLRHRLSASVKHLLRNAKPSKAKRQD